MDHQVSALYELAIVYMYWKGTRGLVGVRGAGKCI